MISKKIIEFGGDDWVFDQIAEAKPVQHITDQLGCSRNFIYTWLDDDEDGSRREKYQEARTRSADALVDRGLEILDNLDGIPLLTSQEVQRANSQANYRKSMAEMRDDSLRAKPGQFDLNVNIGSLHLDALQAHGQMPIPIAAPEEVPVIEAEVIG